MSPRTDFVFNLPRKKVMIYFLPKRQKGITSELKNLMYRRDRLKIKALRTGDPSDWSNFKKLRNEVNKSTKNVKKFYYYKAFETYNGNSRKTWETISEVTRRKSDKAAINELELNGVLLLLVVMVMK